MRTISNGRPRHRQTVSDESVEFLENKWLCMSDRGPPLLGGGVDVNNTHAP